MWILQDSVLKTLYKQGSDVEGLDQPEDLQGDVEDYGESWKGITQGAVPIASSRVCNRRCSLFYKEKVWVLLPRYLLNNILLKD